jgi:DNA-binding response OmpR family regulator
MRVLIVDDEVDIAETLGDLLALIGYEVDVAFDGATALQKAEAVTPDVIVSDSMMPLLSGPELVAQLRERPQLAQIPVILMSAALRAEEAAKLGARFLRKPFDIKQLTALIEELRS